MQNLYRPCIGSLPIPILCLYLYQYLYQYMGTTLMLLLSLCSFYYLTITVPILQAKMQMVVMIPQSITFLIPLNSTVAHIWELIPSPLSYLISQDHSAVLGPFQGKPFLLLPQTHPRAPETVMFCFVNHCVNISLLEVKLGTSSHVHVDGKFGHHSVSPNFDTF